MVLEGEDEDAVAVEDEYENDFDVVGINDHAHARGIANEYDGNSMTTIHIKTRQC